VFRSFFKASRRTTTAISAATAVDRTLKRDDDEITVFDSTGLAVQDLAVAVAVYEVWRANREREEFVGITEITL
jgi:alanine dehydrogenase